MVSYIAKSCILLTTPSHAHSYTPQTIQGADMLAHSTTSLVVMPDYFRGETVDHSRYPPKNDEDKQVIMGFIQTTANPAKKVEETNTYVQALKAQYGASKVGIMGLCWGACGLFMPLRMARD